LTKGYSAAIAQACTLNLLAVIPSTFCYLPADSVNVTAQCPSGYTMNQVRAQGFSSSAWCQPNPVSCKAGYYQPLLTNQCVSNCPANYYSSGYVCYPGSPGSSLVGGRFIQLTQLQPINQSVYTLANPPTLAPSCPTYRYLNQSYCVKDCTAIPGYVNCGPLACASSSAVCAANIINMVFATLMGIAQSLSLILSAGTDAGAMEGVDAAKKSVSQAILKAGGTAMAESVKVVRGIAANPSVVKTLINKAASAAASSLKNVGISEGLAAVTDVCQQFGTTFFSAIQTSQNSQPSFSLASYDFTGIYNSVTACGNTTDPNFGIDCAKAITTSLSVIDPTGIAGIASAFLNPLCPTVYWS